MMETNCPLCMTDGGALVFRRSKFRVIRANEAGFPAFYRLIWNTHVAEFSDLNPEDRTLCMSAVCAVELALRTHLQPRKINLAALGNVVPHLHWHVIARFDWDSHFPSPVWAQAKSSIDEVQQSILLEKLKQTEQEMVLRLTALD